MSAQVAADLRAAAEVLERGGWTQGRYYRPETGCRCAIGAIVAVLGGHDTEFTIPDEAQPRWRAVEGALEAHLNHFIDIWNDEPGRTADEVIAALRAAADAAEADQ